MDVPDLCPPFATKCNEVKGSVEELQKAVTEVAVRRAGVDRAWVLSTLRQNVLRAMQRGRVLDREGKPIGVFTYNGQVANLALELIGKEPGMFRNRLEQFEWDGDLTKLTDAQLDKLLQQFEPGCSRWLATQPMRAGVIWISGAMRCMIET